MAWFVLLIGVMTVITMIAKMRERASQYEADQESVKAKLEAIERRKEAEQRGEEPVYKPRRSRRRR